MSRATVKLPRTWQITRVVAMLGDKVLCDLPAEALQGPGGSRVTLAGGVVLFFDTSEPLPTRRRAAGAAVAAAGALLRAAGPVVASWATVAACVRYLLS